MCVWIRIVVFGNQGPCSVDDLRSSTDRQCSYIRQHHVQYVRGIPETPRQHNSDGQAGNLRPRQWYAPSTVFDRMLLGEES